MSELTTDVHVGQYACTVNRGSLGFPDCGSK